MTNPQTALRIYASTDSPTQEDFRVLLNRFVSGLYLSKWMGIARLDQREKEDRCGEDWA